jgi:methionyl-tRNA formyltransferase
MPSLRIVFMGTPDFAVPSLDALLLAGYPVVAVVTGPDKPRGRGREPGPTAVKTAALSRNLPLLEPDALSDPDLVRILRDTAPDLIVVAAFRILPPSIFTIPRLGSFNLHASLLPRYRGAAPVNWAIINGETETGVTTFFLEERVDTGTVILQAKAAILPDDDAGSLHDRLALLGADLVVETVRRVEAGTAVPRPQDPSIASRAPKIHKEDCRVAWDRPVERVRNLIRGLAPHPAAWTTHAGKVVKLFRSEVYDRETGAPGTVALETGSIVVQCADGRLRLLDLQLEGRRRMASAEFLRGYALQTGDALV